MKSTAPFICRQFSVQHARSAFKVGTDSILLGSWVNAIEPKKILDIGTGSGILSLMMAQRFHADITAVEIDPSSAKEAQQNFQHSKWSNRLHLIEGDINIISSSLKKEVDLVISNPPFFNRAITNTQQRSTVARHDDRLNFRQLVSVVSRVLVQDGTFALILPVSEMLQLIDLSSLFFLKPQRICMVKSFENTDPIRMMVQFGYKSGEVLQKEEIFLYSKPGVRSTAYHKLTEDFYV